LEFSAIAKLCRIDTGASERFSGNLCGPHLAARETHQRSCEFSSIDEKGLFQHNLPEAVIDWVSEPAVQPQAEKPTPHRIPRVGQVSVSAASGVAV
jgi:hypothetical protein